MKAKTILIVTGSALSNNPRAWKEACALARGGYEVEVLGAWLDPHAKKRDLELLDGAPIRFHPVLDVAAKDWRSRLAVGMARAANRLGKLVHRLFGYENSLQLGIAEWPLRRAALARHADLAVAHSEYAMPAAVELLRRGRRVGIDLEDWFSHDLPASSRRFRPVHSIESMERILLAAGAYRTCPSNAMSEAVAAAYGCEPPLVVYNAFPLADRRALAAATAADRTDAATISIHWYSQTLGEGRGLEDLLGALAHMKQPVQVHLRGHVSDQFREWVFRATPEGSRQRVHIHAPVAPGELLARIAEHDIGFAGETTGCESRDTTVTNKILHYLLGGLAVVASDTRGQAEVARLATGAVLLYPSGKCAALAEVLDSLIAHPQALEEAKRRAVEAAGNTFCWELQERVVLAAAARAFDRLPAAETSP